MMKSKKSTQTPNRILGVDPGYGRIGIAVIENKNRNLVLVHSECFETSAKIPHPERLFLIENKFDKVLDKFKPDEMAIETLLWSKNVKTAIKVSEARGVVLSAAAKRKMEISEFNPNSVKLAVTGYGKSDKKQVINMVEKLLKINHKIKHDDEYDAIAIAITAAVSRKIST